MEAACTKWAESCADRAGFRSGVGSSKITASGILARVHWMSLITHRDSADAAWLKERFAVRLDDYRHPHLGSSAPTRQLDWVLRDPDVSAWLELTTGSLILIEAVGGEELGCGWITARMHVQPAQHTIDLHPRQDYIEESASGRKSHASVLAAMIERVHARVPGFAASSEGTVA